MLLSWIRENRYGTANVDRRYGEDRQRCATTDSLVALGEPRQSKDKQQKFGSKFHGFHYCPFEGPPHVVFETTHENVLKYVSIEALGGTHWICIEP